MAGSHTAAASSESPNLLNHQLGYARKQRAADVMQLQVIPKELENVSRFCNKALQTFKTYEKRMRALIRTNVANGENHHASFSGRNTSVSSPGPYTGGRVVALSEQESRAVVETLEQIIGFTNGDFWPNLEHKPTLGTVSNPYYSDADASAKDGTLGGSSSAASSQSPSAASMSMSQVRRRWNEEEDEGARRLAVARAMSAACGEFVL